MNAIWEFIPSTFVGQKEALIAVRWYGYLQFFPKRLDHLPLFWSEEDLRSLSGTTVLAKMFSPQKRNIHLFPQSPPSNVKRQLLNEVFLSDCSGRGAIQAIRSAIHRAPAEWRIEGFVR